MGQTAGVGCSFGELQLCQSDDASGGSMVLPQRCIGVSGGVSQGTISKAYGLDFGSSAWSAGAFGTTLNAVHRASEGTRVARAVPKAGCAVEATLHKLEALRCVEHPNLVRTCDSLEDARYVWQIMEVSQGKQLFHAVATIGPKRLTEWCIAHLMRQLLLGLRQLHAAGLVHEDVRPANILVDHLAPGGPDPRLRLTNCGICLDLRSEPSSPSCTQCLHCMAPEQLSDSPRTEPLEETCDMWAVGAITFALLSGQWPFEADSQEQLRRKIRSGLWAFMPAEAWRAVTERGKALVSTLLVAQADKRQLAVKALSHPFLRLDALDKAALQPMVRSSEVIRGLRTRSGRDLILNAAVDAMASQVPAKQLPDLRKHLVEMDSSGRGCLTLKELRLGLVQGGLEMPGQLLPALLATDSDAWKTPKAAELIAAATRRRQELEEVLLWAAWTTVVSEGVSHVGRAEAGKVLERGGMALRLIIGVGSGEFAGLCSVAEMHLPPQVSFEDLLTWMRSTANNRKSTANLAGGRWPRTRSRPPLQAELTINIPSHDGC